SHSDPSIRTYGKEARAFRRAIRSCARLKPPAPRRWSPEDAVREEHRGPRDDGRGKIDRRQQGDEIVNAIEMRQHPEANRHELGAGQPRAESRECQGRTDERVSLDAESPDAHTEIRVRAVEALDENEDDDDEIAEQTARRVPSFVQDRQETHGV